MLRTLVAALVLALGACSDRTSPSDAAVADARIADAGDATSERDATA